jgi:hypothetical protein
MLKVFCFMAVVVLVFSSCTSTRYSHYYYVKAPKKTTHSNTANSKKTVKQSINVAGLHTSTTKPFANGTDTIVFKPQHIVATQFYNKQGIKSPQKTKQKTDALISNQHNKAKQGKIYTGRKLNENAKEAFFMALRGILIMMIPFAGWIMGFIMLVRATKMALLAIKEIDNEPDKYYGMGLAMITILFCAMVFFSLAFLLYSLTGVILSESVGYTYFFY